MRDFKLNLAEFIGTFALVFLGTGAILFNKISSGVIGQIGISLSFGLIVMAIIAGPISGASMNPARSVGPAIASGNLQFLWIVKCATFRKFFCIIY